MRRWPVFHFSLPLLLIEELLFSVRLENLCFLHSKKYVRIWFRAQRHHTYPVTRELKYEQFQVSRVFSSFWLFSKELMAVCPDTSQVVGTSPRAPELGITLWGRPSRAVMQRISFTIPQRNYSKYALTLSHITRCSVIKILFSPS